MTKKQEIKIFEDKRVRTVWDSETEQWYFCVVDVVEVLTDSKNPTDYIKKMKKRDPSLAEGWGQIVPTPFLYRQLEESNVSTAQHNRDFSVSSSPSHLLKPNLSSNGWHRLHRNVSTRTLMLLVEIVTSQNVIHKTSILYKSILRSDDIDNRFRGGKR